MSLGTPRAEIHLPLQDAVISLRLATLHFGEKVLLARVASSIPASNRQRQLFSASVLPKPPQICGKHMCTHSAMTSLPVL